MDQSQRGTTTDHSNSLLAMSSSQMPHVLFREIHKNAFLKRHSPDRRAGFPKKSERVWVVFCVHDDVEAFLEIYPDQKVALTHKPEWFVSLANALHVSPSICGHEDEFEFAVTLSTQVVRLTAPTWEAMMEWVDTIRNKLRELKVLSPKENLYSKMPEQKQPLLPTRDPNSPLPLPPDGPSTLLPGVEPVHLDSRNNVSTSESNGFSRQQRDGFNRNNLNHERRTPLRQECTSETNFQFERETTQNNEVPTVSHHPLNHNTNTENNICSTSEKDVISNRSRIGLHRTVSIPESSAAQRIHSSSIPTCSNITVIEVSCPSKRNSHSASECSNFDYVDYNAQEEQDVDDVFVMPPTTPKLIVNNSSESTGINSSAHYEHVFLPNPVVTVENSVSLNPSDPITLHSNEMNSPLPTVESESNININGESSSHTESLICSSSSSVSILNSNCHKKTVVVNLPSASSASDYKNGAGKKFEENCCISQQIQSKLEKVPVPGLIPRVPAKSSKHEIGKKNHQGAAKSSANVNANATEAGKSTADAVGLLGQQTTELVEAKSSHAEEVVPNANMPLSAYAQAVKPSRGKIRGEGASTSQEQPRSVPSRTAAADAPEQPPRSERSDPDSSGHKSQGKADGKQATTGNEMPGRKAKHCNPSRSEIFLPSGDKSQSAPSGKYRSDSSACAPSTSGMSRTENGTRMNFCKREGPSQGSSGDVEPLTATVQPAVGVISVEDIPLIGGHQRRRRRSSSSEAAATSGNITRSIAGADRIRINVPVTQPGREPHREEAEGRCPDARNEAEHNSHGNVATKSSARLTLREQQVLQLRREIMHSGGVRLQLRRKECVGSIALVDVLNGVWIAGWKQREHPMLYNALHIGDQLISVSDVVVRSAADAQKMIRTSSSIYIELIIRRVPFGRVFALHRSSEGQNLGIVQEGNTAEIRDVLPNSIAAHAGLSAKTPSVDGLSLTTWFLTEVNGRPLNLFFKDNEVRDRLNSVGKDISILVQPHDFIKQIKKNLKNIRSYKDYIVQ